MKFRQSPCYKEGVDCPKRHLLCHETCQEYKEWRAELDADNKAKSDAVDREYINYILPKIHKRKKRKNEKNST